MPKRVRAARGAVNMSLNEFAEAIQVGRSTLVRIEGGDREPKAPELERMAQVSGMPLAFFLVDDLDAVLEGHEDPTVSRRLADLEEVVRSQGDAIAALQALATRRVLEDAARASDAKPATAPRPGRR